MLLGRVRAEQSYTGLGHIWSNPLGCGGYFLRVIPEAAFCSVESIRNQGGSSEPQAHCRASFQVLQRDSAKAKPAMARSVVQLKACSYILPASSSLLLQNYTGWGGPAKRPLVCQSKAAVFSLPPG